MHWEEARLGTVDSYCIGGAAPVREHGGRTAGGGYVTTRKGLDG